MRSHPQVNKSFLWAGVLTFMAGTASLWAGTQATFYVSPSGNDANPGTSKLAAFASLAKARDTIRAVNATMTGDIIVEVAKGDYLAADTLTFTEKDSGNNGFDIIKGPNGKSIVPRWNFTNIPVSLRRFSAILYDLVPSIFDNPFIV